MVDLTLELAIMQNDAQCFKEKLWAFLEYETNDGFGWSSKQVEEIKDKMNEILDILDEMECEDKEQQNGN